jgi:hypothetical protein
VLFPVPETQSTYHPHAQQSAFRRRDVRPQQRFFAPENQELIRSPTPTGFAQIVSEFEWRTSTDLIVSTYGLRLRSHHATKKANRIIINTNIGIRNLLGIRCRISGAGAKARPPVALPG